MEIWFVAGKDRDFYIGRGIREVINKYLLAKGKFFLNIVYF